MPKHGTAHFLISHGDNAGALSKSAASIPRMNASPVGVGWQGGHKKPNLPLGAARALCGSGPIVIATADSASTRVRVMTVDKCVPGLYISRNGPCKNLSVRTTCAPHTHGICYSDGVHMCRCSDLGGGGGGRFQSARWDMIPEVAEPALLLWQRCCSRKVGGRPATKEP